LPSPIGRTLLPLARATKAQCAQLIAGLGDTQVSVRELGTLNTAWKRADRAGKRQIVPSRCWSCARWRR
jgi:hypothetical protein